MKRIGIRFPILQQYNDCFYLSLGDIGDGLHESRRGVLLSQHATTVNDNLTGGIFATALFLFLLKDATAFDYTRFIAMHSVVTGMAGFAQLLSPLLFERIRNRRRWIYGLTGAGHFINIVILPFLSGLGLPTPIKAYLYIISSGIMSACSAVCGPAYSEWMIHSLPDACRSDFFMLQTTTTELLSQGVSLALSVGMDFYKRRFSEFSGLLLMRGLAVLAVTGQYCARNRMEEPAYQTQAREGSWKNILKAPFSSKPFLFTVFVSMIWAFGTGFGGTYYNAYLLDGAKLSYTYISVCGFIGLPLQLLMLPKWNSSIRSRGWLPTMSVSMFLYGICYAINAMVTERSRWMYLISTVFCKMIAGGVSMGNANLAYLFMPESMKNSCFTFFSVCTSLAGMASAQAAKAACRKTEGKTISLFHLSLENRAYICFFAFAILALDSAAIWCFHKITQKKSIAAQRPLPS